LDFCKRWFLYGESEEVLIGEPRATGIALPSRRKAAPEGAASIPGVSDFRMSDFFTRPCDGAGRTNPVR
jgi:hypothetical protein